MAQGNQFLTIPSQEGLFRAIKKERNAETAENDEEEDDNGDEEEEDDVRLIPRCSPVPRKRGRSLTDETAEYMRIRLALPLRRVSFADASGGELVDVRQFVPFDSDDEEDDARWEEEEAKYRKAYRQPVYRVRPDFTPLSDGDLLLAVRTNKAEIESVRAVADEPLAFDGLIRVLNVSFHKSVHVRSTMDGWISYFDYPADYVSGSNDGETDAFSVRLSFAEPYLFDGARIDFVVRYETDSGEFWANNSGNNYSVTLQVSYEEDPSEDSKVEDVELRGILKPSRYRMDDYYDFSQDEDEGDVAGAERQAAVDGPCAVGQHVVEPEIDIEITEVLSISSSNTSGDASPLECTLPSIEDSSDEHTLQHSAAIPPQTDHPESTGQATESLLTTTNGVSIQPKKTQLEAPDDKLSSHSDSLHTDDIDKNIEVSVKPNIFFPIEDNSQSEISAQVPFDFHTTSLAINPCVQHVGEDEPEELKDGREQIKLEIVGSVARKEDQKIDIQEVSEVLPCPLSEASASQDEGHLSHSIHQDAQSKSLESLSLLKCEMHTAARGTTGRSETSNEQEAGLRVESAQAGGEEGPGILVTCTWHSSGVTHLEHTGKNRVTFQSHPATSDPEESVYHQQRKGHGSQVKELTAVLSVDADTPSTSESTDLKEGAPILTSVCETKQSQDLTSSVKVKPPEDQDRDPYSAEEEPVANDEFEKFYEDPNHLQTQDGLESQPPLPNKNLKALSAQPEVVLGKTLIPPIAFLCAALCLVVGFQEPSIFLVLGLFLIFLGF